MRKWKRCGKTRETIYNLYDYYVRIVVRVSLYIVTENRIYMALAHHAVYADAQNASSSVRLHAPPPPVPHDARYITQKCTNPPRRRKGPIQRLLWPRRRAWWLKYLYATDKEDIVIMKCELARAHCLVLYTKIEFNDFAESLPCSLQENSKYIYLNDCV